MTYRSHFRHHFWNRPLLTELVSKAGTMFYKKVAATRLSRKVSVWHDALFPCSGISLQLKLGPIFRLRQEPTVCSPEDKS